MGPQRPSVLTNQAPANGMSNAGNVGNNGNGVTQSSTGFQFQTQFTDHMSQLGKLTPFLSFLRV
jgi:hypothetical protein